MIGVKFAFVSKLLVSICCLEKLSCNNMVHSSEITIACICKTKLLVSICCLEKLSCNNMVHSSEITIACICKMMLEWIFGGRLWEEYKQDEYVDDDTRDLFNNHYYDVPYKLILHRPQGFHSCIIWESQESLNGKDKAFRTKCSKEWIWIHVYYLQHNYRNWTCFPTNPILCCCCCCYYQ